jgi:hypothetical protein
MTKSEAIAANIAKRITANKTRCRFSTLYRLALEDLQMSTPTSSNGLNATPQPRPRLGRDEMNHSDPSAPAVQGGSTLPREASSDSVSSGFAVGSQLPTIVAKDVDSTVITGSHKSSSDDVSKNFNMDSFQHQAGPRGETTNDENAGA